MLESVDLEVAPRQIAAVVGGNGSGKSTLLRLVAGISRPSAGEIVGRPSEVGYVPERFPATTRMSALAYLRHMGRIQGLSTKKATARSGELLERLELAGGMETPIRELSKGNAQKVAVAQAVLRQPRLLVLDEPWSGLDASAHRVLSDLMEEVTGAGGIVVFTDHRYEVVHANATVVYRIRRGRVDSYRSGSAMDRVSPVEVELFPSHSRPHRQEEVEWDSVRGVFRAERNGEKITLNVDGEYCDELLLEVIRSGWSVRSLRHISLDTVASEEVGL
ncbi:ATP-binding cassette domain-containing protein [Amycolatopsis sp. cmx-11-12]|uniref:ATP-binding cassette domain-containing protein n=1 Tax=Amycolatopsis sp. cmx-11-12 TaxID=2785795 RepID=UPI003917C533